MPETATAAESARMHRLFCDETRVRVLRLLGERGGARVGEMCSALGVEQTACSHHLALLRAARVVDTRRDGRAVVYTVAPDARERLGPLLMFPLGAAS